MWKLNTNECMEIPEQHKTKGKPVQNAVDSLAIQRYEEDDNEWTDTKRWNMERASK